MHVILFDDHELFAKSLAFALEDALDMFETYTDCETVADILAIVDEEKPDIVLLDIHMGEINGLDAGEALLAKYPTLKIVFLSGYHLVEYHNAAIRMGARGFINKNSSINELIEKIQLVANNQIIFPNYEEEAEPLTDREKAVLQLAAEGYKQQEIAEKLFISRRTVNNHIQTINEKFHVNSTVAAIVRGIELGMIRLKNR